MGKPIDMTGQRYGRLSVIEMAGPLSEQVRHAG